MLANALRFVRFSHTIFALPFALGSMLVAAGGFPGWKLCGLIVLAGNPRRLTDLDIREVGASMTVNGVIQESGVARAVMDNPVSSVAWLINKLAEFGVTPKPGHIIMSGSFLKITRFGAGDNVQALFSHGLGEVGFTCA